MWRTSSLQHAHAPPEGLPARCARHYWAVPRASNYAAGPQISPRPPSPPLWLTLSISPQLCCLSADSMQAYITFCQLIVNGNFTFLLCFTFSTPCGFLYQHVEIFICREKYKD